MFPLQKCIKYSRHEAIWNELSNEISHIHTNLCFPRYPCVSGIILKWSSFKYSAVLRKNPVWTLRRCQISFDNTRISWWTHEYLSSNFSGNFFSQFHVKFRNISRKNIHNFPRKWTFYRRKFGNAQMFIRRFSLARQYYSRTCRKEDAVISWSRSKE